MRGVHLSRMLLLQYPKEPALSVTVAIELAVGDQTKVTYHKLPFILKAVGSPTRDRGDHTSFS